MTREFPGHSMRSDVICLARAAVEPPLSSMTSTSIGSLSLEKVGIVSESPLPSTALMLLREIKEQAGEPLARLRASMGWCLDDAQLSELRYHKHELARMAKHLAPSALAHLMITTELAYGAWTAAGKLGTLRHHLAVSRVLAAIKADGEVIEAAMLAGLREAEVGVAAQDLTAILGEEAAAAIDEIGGGVSTVWRLSARLERAAEGADGGAGAGVAEEGGELGASRAEQLERQCQIMLAGCDDPRSIAIALASRLVSMRELYGAMVGQQLGVNRCPPRLATWNLL